MSIAIRAEHVSKEYRLGVINHGMLYKDVQSWAARKLGRPDPHGKIGEDRFADQEDQFWALKDISFDIEEGDRVGIIGKNGAGKSTLLRILSRITAPTEGTVKLKGRVASLLEVGTGFHPELTGRENIYLNGAILGMKTREINRKLEEIIDFSEIEQHIDTPVKRYSSGMYVRLAFAVAAHLDSEILLADEVLAVGDAGFQKKALGKMQDLSTSQGRTVIFVSHNMDAVKRLCNNGVILERGRIIGFDSITKIIHSYINKDIKNIGLGFHRFEDEPGKEFKVLEVKTMKNSGHAADTFEASEKINVAIKCISRNPIPGLYGYFAIKNSENQAVIIFDSTEGKSSYFDSLAPGEYAFNFVIPENILGPSDYTVVMNFTSHFNLNGFNVDSPLESCRFVVIDSLSQRGASRGAITRIIPEMRIDNS